MAPPLVPSPSTFIISSPPEAAALTAAAAATAADARDDEPSAACPAAAGGGILAAAAADEPKTWHWFWLEVDDGEDEPADAPVVYFRLLVETVALREVVPVGSRPRALFLLAMGQPEAL